MKRKLQATLQIGFLGLFIILFIRGQVQIWMGLFLLGILASLLFGRIYCGWICSINTSMKGVSWLKKKLGIKDFAIPDFFKKPISRFMALGLFLIIFILIMITGKKLPILPVLFLTGIILTFLFPEELWHRYLCPYGTILAVSGKESKYSMSIDSDICNNCGICNYVCPAKAVEKHTSSHKITKKDCLVCMECSRRCPQTAINYSKTSTEETTHLS